MVQAIYIGAPEADATDFSRRVQAELPGLDLLATDDRAQALAQAGEAQLIIGHHFQFDDALLQAAPKLRWIQSLTTGTDAILKLPSLRPEVLVTSTRGMHGPQMSELVFLHMLALTRDMPGLLAQQAGHRWERRPQPLLWGKTAVIVGVGAIAEALAPRCRAFGMRVIGVSGSPRPAEGFDEVMSRDQLKDAAALADYLILIVPLSPATENLVDAAVIGALRPEAYLINVARGGVLDEVALLAALKAGRIAGAALDVFREQPLPPASPLWDAPRLLITPLLGGMSNVYLDQAWPIVRANLTAFLAGRTEAMVNVVAH